MTQEQYKEFVEKFGKEAADQMKKLAADVEKSLNEKYESVAKGLMTREDFDKLLKAQEKELNEKIEAITKENSKLEEVLKEQGIVINTLKETGNGHPKQKSLEQFITDQVPTLKKLFKEGGYVEITGTQLKAAGVTSISGSIEATAGAPSSPWLPGIGGADLEIFDIIRNPNFILNKVDVGRTDSFRLAWINETSVEGDTVAATEVEEGGLKPLTQHKFKVEFSEAKKAAAYIELTEEFEQDVPGLATKVRRMLQDDVIRAFDNAIQAAVIAAARPFEMTALNGSVEDATPWDALLSMLGQVAYYNFVANTIALNPLTMVKVMTNKGSDGHYLNPPFISRINDKLVEATKVPVDNGLVGDLKQYKVDIYKEFVLKMGWINDQFIHNKFSIVGEIRYHRYISDNRKKAIVHANIFNVEAAIDGGSPSV